MMKSGTFGGNKFGVLYILTHFELRSKQKSVEVEKKKKNPPPKPECSAKEMACYLVFVLIPKLNNSDVFSKTC